MIPKTIHYCWFGGNEKSALINRCIKSWRKYCPDYEIIEWNEENFDFSNVRFCTEAYNAKKWAFVTDFVRLSVLLENGGIYLDTDVELLKKPDDLLYNDCFMGFEDRRYVNNGSIMGAIPRHSFIKDNMSVYENLSFRNDDGSFNETPSPVYTTELLLYYGLEITKAEQVQYLENGVTVYPCEYFASKDIRTREIRICDHTYSIHHFAGSWQDSTAVNKKLEVDRRRRLERRIGKPAARIVCGIRNRIKRFLNRNKK